MKSLLALAIAAAACAFVPERNVALEQAWNEYIAASSNEHVVRLAAAELAQAHETLERATEARNTLQDPAWVDHLAYVARRQVALSVHMAEWRGAGPETTGVR